MPGRKRKDGEKGSGDCGGHRCSRHPPKPPLCPMCSSAEGNMTCPQQLARASRLHDRAGKGTGAATEASSSSLASTGSVGSGEGPGTGSPRARRVTLGQPCSQPVCARPSGSQQSRSGRLGWRRRQDWPGSQHRTDLFPSLSGHLPTPLNSMA